MTIHVEVPRWWAAAACRQALSAVTRTVGLHHTGRPAQYQASRPVQAVATQTAPAVKTRNATAVLGAPAALIGRLRAVAVTALPRPSRRRDAPARYSWAPREPVPAGAWAPPKRWPSRVAPAGLLLAVAMAVGGAIVATPDKAGLRLTEDPLALRLAYEPSKLRWAEPEVWAGGLPPEAKPWVPAIQAIAVEEGIDPRLLASVVWVESRFNPVAVSPKGAVGLAQVMPETAKELGIRIRDPLENLAGGAHYLRVNIERFGSVDLALAAYNGGPTRMTAAKTLSRLTEPEIRVYVERVLQTYRGLGGET